MSMCDNLPAAYRLLLRRWRGEALSRKWRGVAIFGSVSLSVANERCVVKAHAATERGVSPGCIWLIQ